MKNIITQSATTFAIEHFFFEDTSIYLRFFLRHGDPADYLRQASYARLQEKQESGEDEAISLVDFALMNAAQSTSLNAPTT